MCCRYIGKNLLFFDVTLTPITYMFISKFDNIFPKYNYFTPLTVKEFMFSLAEKFDFKIEDKENPFLVNDGTLIKDFDKEFWLRNYQKLSRDAQYYIDMTKLRDGYGMLYVGFLRLLSGNTLGVPQCEYINQVLPNYLVKEHFSENPKL